MNTYQSFYQNEIRALELTIDDQDGNDFIPSAAWVEVQDSAGTAVVAEQAAMVDSSNIRTIIGTATTGTVGTYKVIWRLARTGYTYFHVTLLEVQPL